MQETISPMIYRLKNSIMKQITINNQQFNLPETFDDITISQYFKLIDIYDTLNAQANSNESHEPEITSSHIDFISTFFKIPNKDIESLDVSTFNELWILASSFSPPTENLIKYTFKLNNVEYGYRYDVSKMQTHEFIDYDALRKLVQEDQKNITKLTALLYRPIVSRGPLIRNKDVNYTIEKYDSDTLDERSDLFALLLPVSIAFSACFFQIALVQAFTDVSLKRNLRTQSKHNSPDSQANGAS